jgi:NAD+ diphosphatase
MIGAKFRYKSSSNSLKCNPMPFIPGFLPPDIVEGSAIWFLFHEQKLLIKEKDEKRPFLTTDDLDELKFPIIQRQYLGSLDGRHCYTAEIHDPKQISGDYTFIEIRDIFTRFDEDLIQVAGLANQLINWTKKHRYCGKCGKSTKDKEDERAKICLECGSIYYPRLSPAIIVAVHKGNQILLANSKRFPVNFYSTLAGFVEPGETLEECVKREILEEVGITVKNIRYFGSQPWPFPDSLMIAFTAEFAGGEIRIDDVEIADAGWFSPDNLPLIPPKISIARKLIDWFTGEY